MVTHRSPDELARLLGESPAIESVRATLRRVVARHPRVHRLPPVLLQGETGTGKGLVASILHRIGPRAGGPFVDVNCAAMPDTLIEAELFGFERGAFTDARQAKPGLFQMAHGGTIFLDEIGLLAEPLQAKLLKVLEERVVRRLGSTHSEPADAWVISATNADLAMAVRERRFRSDLYHRLAVLTLALPPLRARGADVSLLSERFLDQVCADYGLPLKRFSEDAHARLRAYAWPGNVRELANVVERAVLFTEGSVITGQALAELEEAPSRGMAPEAAAVLPTDAPVTHDQAMRQHYLAVLEQTGWNLSRTAAILEITRNTLRARMERFGLQRPGAARGGAPAGVRPGPSADRPPASPQGLVEPAPDPQGDAVLPVAPSSAAPPMIRWERRWVTFLRADVGAPEAMDDRWLRNRPLDLAIGKVLGFGGRLETVSRTSLGASFGLEPIDEAPRRAALAALAIQKALHHLSPAVGEARAIQVAVHTSEQMIASVAGTYQINRDVYDETSPVLEALLDLPDPGSVLVSRAAEPFLSRRFRLEPVVKPDGRPIAYRLLGAQVASQGLQWRGRGFVGRRQEGDLLRSRWASAIQGHGQVVALVGEPGVGKSRLVWEFTRNQDLGSALRLETSSMALSRGTPYLPVVDLLRTYFGLDTEDAGAIRRRVTEKVLDLDEALAATLPALLSLLEVLGPDERWDVLDPLERRGRMLDAVKRLFLRESRRQPVLLVFEDTHWVDSETQAVLDGLVDALGSVRMLLLVTYRPEYQHRWASKSAYTQLRIDPLPHEDAGTLLRGLIGDRESEEILAELRRLLIERTDGNPFFLEESVRSLVETGALVGEPGAYRLIRPVRSLGVPGTVAELLAARIDRRPADEKRLLQLAAVVGRDVSLPILARVAGQAIASLGPPLHQLQAAEFLYERVDSTEPQYTFRHALTHEATYGTLPEAERRTIHVQVLEAMEALYEARQHEHLEALGHHALRGELWEKAVDYLRRAGAKAIGRSTNREAVAYLEQALSALQRLPVERQRLELTVDLQFQLRNALQPLGEFQAMREHLLAAQEAATALGDLRRQGQAAAYLGDHFRLTGDHPRAIEWGERAHAIAASLGDVALQVNANTYLGQIHLIRGDYRRAMPFFEQNVSMLVGDLETERFGTPQPSSVHNRTCLTWCLAELGDFSEGIALGEGGIRIAETLEQPGALVTAYAGLGYLKVLRGDAEQAVTILEPAVRLARDAERPLWFPRVASALGRAYTLVGKLADAIALVEEALKRAQAMRLVNGRALMQGILADARMRAGQVEVAAELGREALQLAQEQEERGNEAWLRLGLGQIALARTTPAAAEEALEHFHTCLAGAGERGMRPLTALAHLALGQAYASTSDRASAERHLGKAIVLLGELEMRRWLPEAEGRLRALR